MKCGTSRLQEYTRLYVESHQEVCYRRWGGTIQKIKIPTIIKAWALLSASSTERAFTGEGAMYHLRDSGHSSPGPWFYGSY